MALLTRDAAEPAWQDPDAGAGGAKKSWDGGVAAAAGPARAGGRLHYPGSGGKLTYRQLPAAADLAAAWAVPPVGLQPVAPPMARPPRPLIRPGSLVDHT